jgi:hypothetical protein
MSTRAGEPPVGMIPRITGGLDSTGCSDHRTSLAENSGATCWPWTMGPAQRGHTNRCRPSRRQQDPSCARGDHCRMHWNRNGCCESGSWTGQPWGTIVDLRRTGISVSLETDVRWKRETFFDNDKELLTLKQPCEGLLARLTRQFESIVERECHYADTTDLLVIVVNDAFQRIQDWLREVVDIGSKVSIFSRKNDLDVDARRLSRFLEHSARGFLNEGGIRLLLLSGQRSRDPFHPERDGLRANPLHHSLRLLMSCPTRQRERPKGPNSAAVLAEIGCLRANGRSRRCRGDRKAETLALRHDYESAVTTLDSGRQGRP